MKYKNTLVATLMSLLLLVAGAPAANAAEQSASSPDKISVDSAPKSADAQTSDVTPRVGAGWAGKQGAKLLAKALRSPTADKVIDGINWGDDAAKAAVKSNKGAVADVLDKISEFTDIPSRVVKEKSFDMLLQAGLSGGDAKMIADTLGIIIGAVV